MRARPRVSSEQRPRYLRNHGARLSYYYHIRITERGQGKDEVRNDLNEEGLERHFLVPYRAGKPITINGKAIPPGEIERIRISRSGEPSDRIIDRLRRQDRLSNAARADEPSFQWRAADQATDVTDQYITGPPGTEITASTLGVPAGPGDKRSIFIVSGRGSGAVEALEELLRAVDLRIIEWEHAVEREGSPNPYIGNVVLIGLQMADAVLVVLTPDDLVLLRPDLLNSNDEQTERTLQGQARPNVFYEAGIADAYGQKRTIIVEIGPAKSFSDISGRSLVRYDGSSKQRQVLVERLRRAGLEPNTSGTAWLSAGDVGPSIGKAQEAIREARRSMMPEQDPDLP
jgi:predicted nucleotide-binding protein